MSPLAWKPGAGVHEDIKSFVADAFHRNSSRYQPDKTWQHNSVFEFLGSSAEGVDDMFKPSSHVLALDLETTGIGPNTEVVQFYSRLYDKDLNAVDEGIEMIASPSSNAVWESGARDLAEKAGLTDAKLSGGMSQQELSAKLQAHLDDLVSKHGKFHALGSNVRFDLGRIGDIVGKDNLSKYFHDNVLDTMSLGAYAAGKAGESHGNFGLGSLAERAKIKNSLAHNAKFDTETAVGVYKHYLSSIFGIKAPAVARSTAKPVVKKAIKGGPGWKTMAVAAVGIGLVGMASRSEPDPVEVQGIRKPYGPHDTIHGINTSSRLTPFGSGRNTFLQFLQEANLPGDPWIRSSSLGFTTQEEINRVYLEGFEDDPEARGRTSAGNEVHHKIQSMLIRQGMAIGAEVEVTDPEMKVQGAIDVLLKGNIPLEVKTVETMKDLRQLMAAKETAISQANAYAVMARAPYSIVMYTSREDQSQYKSFKIPVNYERYRADVERIRLGIQRLPGRPVGHNSLLVNAKQVRSYLTQPNGFFSFPSMDEERARAPEFYAGPTEGIRQSYPTSSGQFEAMNSHPEASFPGGRTQNYGALPTMKPPINHGYRNQHRHAVGYRPRVNTASHPIRSRAERSHV